MDVLKVKELTIKLSGIEISAYRLADSIQKTQKRSNALSNITTRLKTLIKKAIDALEEKIEKNLQGLKLLNNKKLKKS